MDVTDAATNDIIFKGPRVAIVASTAAKDDHVKADDGVESLLSSVPPPPLWQPQIVFVAVMMAGSNNGKLLQHVGSQWLWWPIIVLSAKDNSIEADKGGELLLLLVPPVLSLSLLCKLPSANPPPLQSFGT
jgi:hypothetical protein